jgi:hypothetical protein
MTAGECMTGTAFEVTLETLRLQILGGSNIETTITGSALKDVNVKRTYAADGARLILDDEGGGSLLGSLAQMNNRAHERERDKAEQNKQQNFPPNDPTGDKTVAGLLDKSRNPNS